MIQAKILWADDEIDLLKPHIIFLQQKGYEVVAVNNGTDAVDAVDAEDFDVVFLDENMPGISGLEALNRIKEKKPLIPVVMITKSEEEYIMEEAIGSKISDYLIKPVNPNQILLSLKRILDHQKLVSQKTSSNYQQEFRQLGMQLSGRLDEEEWVEVYKKLVFWELELQDSDNSGMEEILRMQKKEANTQFCKFIERNYLDWVNIREDGPNMIHNAMRKFVLPHADKEKTFMILIDNLRYDQWKMIEPIISRYFTVDSDEVIFSILPTATHYARNAFFAGLMPLEIAKKHPDLWKEEDDEGSKNMFEEDFLAAQLKRLGKNYKWSYHKVTNLTAGKKLVDNFNQLKDNQLNTVVYNFVDMLSHARTEMEMIKELAEDEAAYRSITKSWFEHSPLLDLIRKIAEHKYKLIITTDHGTVKVTNPVRIVGEKSTNTNLRYKTGRNLSYNQKEVFQVRNTEEAFLPRQNVSSEYVFARDQDFFVYPNNYNKFVQMYADTFQHGGISMEEIMIPMITLSAK